MIKFVGRNFFTYILGITCIRSTLGSFCLSFNIVTCLLCQ